eukprot:COSAG06_NODE_42309_length_383_cov_0.545775_1_plen_49_part_10
MRLKDEPNSINQGETVLAEAACNCLIYISCNSPYVASSIGQFDLRNASG